MESKVSKNWLGIFGSILFAATLMLTARVVLAHEAQNVSESQNGRLYKNLFEYRMCMYRDNNWCSEGDNFKATLFDSMYLNPALGSDPAYYWTSGTGLEPHYPTSTTGTLTRYPADFCEAGEPNLDGTCPEVHGFDVVRCLDGTRPLFYYEAGQGADSNKWVFKIQGGGDQCSEGCPVSILQPDIRPDFSSAYNENPNRRNAPGIFSNNGDNYFKNYNTVLLDKCFGDRNQGDATYTDVFSGALGLEEGTGPVYFHGYRVILATLRRLNRDFNLADAEHIVFVTQSNGSNGGYTYIDRLADHVSTTLEITAPVYLLASSFVAPGPEVEYSFEHDSWPLNYTDIATSTEVSPGIINAPNTSPTESCGPPFDPLDPYYADWLVEAHTPTGGVKCDRNDPDYHDGGVHGKAYATDDYQNGREATNFDIWGADNGLTATWDESCLKAHALDPDLRACRDSRHVMTHHLQTPTFFAAQSADRNLRTTDKFLTMWSPEGTVWWPEDMKLRVEKLAEVISGYQTRSKCADEDLGGHGFFLDNTVDHLGLSDMEKLTRKMKANSGAEAGFNFQLQHYLAYWLQPSAPTVQCLDSNDLYDVEFDPPDVTVTPVITSPVKGWPAFVQCKVGYYLGGSRPHQPCDDPGFGDPSNPTLNRADDRFVCQAPPLLEYLYLPILVKPAP